VTVELRGVETQVHYANMRGHNFDVGDAGWNGDFNDAKNYLFLFETRSGQQNYTGFSNPRYDQLVRDSDFEADAGRRAQLMLQAEQLLLDEGPVCAAIFQNSTNLVHPDLTGYEDNVEDIHRARWFGIRNA
jgi:oligopeptide transport system substrate-binding protein